MSQYFKFKSGGEDDFISVEIDRIEFLRRTAMTYYWLYVHTDNEYYKHSAFEVGYKYKKLKSDTVDKTITLVA